MIRLVLRLVALLAVLLLIGYGVLRATNPSPRPSEGWERLADMPGARGEVAAAMVDGKLVVAGGLAGVGRTSRDVSNYDVETDEWDSGPLLPEGRHHAAAAAARGYVYVSGGASGATDWTPRRDVWRLKPEPGASWEEVPSMPAGRQGHAMAAHDGKLYVVGGVGGASTLIYDVKEDEWTTGAGLPESRDHLRAVAWDGKIWAIAGRTGDPTDRIDIYDPNNDRWAGAPDLPESMSAMAVGVVDDVLHVIGGEDPDFFAGGVTESHYVLGSGSVTWRRASSPILAVHGGAADVHESRLYIAGGASRQGGLSVLSWTGVAQAFEVD